MIVRSDDTPWSNWISADRIVTLHEGALQLYGGASGPADPVGCVDGALGAAYSAELYIEGHKRARAGLSFAAYALYYIVRRHCFVDGNKRAAWLAAADILASIGLGINATPDEGFALMEDILSGRIDTAEHVVTWLARRLFSLD